MVSPKQLHQHHGQQYTLNKLNVNPLEYSYYTNKINVIRRDDTIEHRGLIHKNNEATVRCSTHVMCNVQRLGNSDALHHASLPVLPNVCKFMPDHGWGQANSPTAYRQLWCLPSDWGHYLMPMAWEWGSFSNILFLKFALQFETFFIGVEIWNALKYFRYCKYEKKARSWNESGSRPAVWPGCAEGV